MTSLKRKQRKHPGWSPILDVDEQAELVRLRREVRRLETENEILKRAAAYFAKENVLPKTSFRLIEQLTAEDPHRFKVATVSRLLGVSRSGYYTWAQHRI